jgi:5-formyltetrahydrofolate cyclo-ligase
MLARRDRIPPTQLDYLSSKISQRLLQLRELENAKTISMYLNKGSEVRTKEILAWCIARGKRVIIPVTDRANRRLVFSELKAPERELQVGTFGILEPKPEFLRSVPLEEAQVVLVPGIAWDLQGYRIGYGGGYYDRTINSLRNYVFMIGLAYELQIINEIPTTRYDRPVHRIITEYRTIATRPATSAIWARRSLR